ncbi:Uncharacterized protein Rs2_28293 [Raphanus sativus]|nr:Uncharacterized protein Rs2_28293 [Raphanus sativus]
MTPLSRDLSRWSLLEINPTPLTSQFESAGKTSPQFRLYRHRFSSQATGRNNRRQRFPCCTCTKVDEEGVAAAMILSLTESLQSCKDEIASCQSELESAKAEIDKWNSAFKKESFVPARKSPG